MDKSSVHVKWDDGTVDRYDYAHLRFLRVMPVQTSAK